MNEKEIFSSKFWMTSHRLDSRYLGFLIVSSIEKANDLGELSQEALAEMGQVLSLTEKILKSTYSPFKIIISKMGFSSGFSLHFHIIPISDLILQQITQETANDKADGVDAMKFICRQYCERELNSIETQNIIQEVIKLRNIYDKLSL